MIVTSVFWDQRPLWGQLRKPLGLASPSCSFEQECSLQAACRVHSVRFVISWPGWRRQLDKYRSKILSGLERWLRVLAVLEEDPGWFLALTPSSGPPQAPIWCTYMHVNKHKRPRRQADCFVSQPTNLSRCAILPRMMVGLAHHWEAAFSFLTHGKAAPTWATEPSMSPLNRLCWAMRYSELSGLLGFHFPLSLKMGSSSLNPSFLWGLILEQRDFRVTKTSMSWDQEPDLIPLTVTKPQVFNYILIVAIFS